MRINRIIMAAMLLGTALAVSAQRKVGSFTIQPKVGMTVSSMTNDPQMGVQVLTYKEGSSTGGDFTFTTGEEDVRLEGVSFAGIKEKIGLVAGAEAEYQVSRRLGLSAGVLYSMQGARYNDFHGSNIAVTDAKIRLEYINIPIMANFYVVKGLALKAGLQPAFCVKNEVKGDVTVRVDEGWNLYAAQASMPDFTTFDLSVPVGVSYEYNNFVIGAMYNIGLTNVFSGNWDGGEKPSAHNSVWQITLGYNIEL